MILGKGKKMKKHNQTQKHKIFCTVQKVVMVFGYYEIKIFNKIDSYGIFNVAYVLEKY